MLLKEQEETIFGKYRPDRIYIDMIYNNSEFVISQTILHETAHRIFTSVTNLGNFWSLISDILTDDDIVISNENRTYLENTKKVLLYEMRDIQEIFAMMMQLYSYKDLDEYKNMKFDNILIEFKKSYSEYWELYRLDSIAVFLDGSKESFIKIFDMLILAMNADFSGCGLFDAKFAKKIRRNTLKYSPKTRFRKMISYAIKHEELFNQISVEEIARKCSLEYSVNDQHFINLLESIMKPLHLNIDKYLHRSDVDNFSKNHFVVPSFLNKVDNIKYYKYKEGMPLSTVNVIYIEKYENYIFEGALYDTIRGIYYSFKTHCISHFLMNINTIITNRHYYKSLKRYFNKCMNIFILMGQLNDSAFEYVDEYSKNKKFSYYCFRDMYYGVLFLSGEENNEIFLQLVLHEDIFRILKCLPNFKEVMCKNDGIIETINRNLLGF